MTDKCTIDKYGYLRVARKFFSIIERPTQKNSAREDADEICGNQETTAFLSLAARCFKTYKKKG